MPAKSQRRRSKSNTQSAKWPEKMRVSLAREFLGVSPAKMTNLLSSGILSYERDYLDNRVKLINKSDLEALLEKHKNY